IVSILALPASLHAFVLALLLD
ncbi:hypothetical protein Tco_0544337, partial [Tanacetum coccineum]